MCRNHNRLNVLLAIFLMLFLITNLSCPNVNLVTGIYAQLPQEEQKYSIVGMHTSGAFGAHFDGVGDVSGDGIDDFIIGECYHLEGRLYLFLGRLDNDWSNLTLSDAHASFVGESHEDWFGRWTTGLGDVNGDGFNDFAVSAMANDEGGSMAGKVYVFFGSETGWPTETLATQANVSITGEATEDRMGHGVYGIGDTNGDGYDDFIVSAFWNDDGGIDAGQLYLFLGRPQNQWLDSYSGADASASWVGNPGDGLSLDAAGVGDVNNDGFTDFVVGAFARIDEDAYRKVYLILGSDEANWSMDQPISQSNASFVGPSDTEVEALAISADWISGAGDVNNDGFDDLVIGAFEENAGGAQAGQTYIFFGRPTNYWTHDIPFSSANASFLGVSPGDFSGWEVDGIGDFNGDSYADIVISAPPGLRFPARTEDNGHVYIILGTSTENWKMNTSLAQADYSYISEQTHSGYGFHVQGIGDVNNDGLDDFAIGAPGFDESSYDLGKTYLILSQIPETTSTTTSTTTPTTTPTIDIILVTTIIGGVVGVLIVLVIFLKRRS